MDEPARAVPVGPVPPVPEHSGHLGTPNLGEWVHVMGCGGSSIMPSVEPTFQAGARAARVTFSPLAAMGFPEFKPNMAKNPTGKLLVDIRGADANNIETA